VPTVNSTSSSTFEVIGDGEFNITYADQSKAEGSYVKESLRIGDSEVKGLQMGLAMTISRATGIMGIGYSVPNSGDSVYPSVMEQMVTQNLINSRTYSLYLDALGKWLRILQFTVQNY
jgi:Eukaryotic aspartyl protease